MKLDGLGIALITPFDNDGKVDFNSLDRLLGHVAASASYIVVNGTTGEAAATTEREKQEVIDFVVDKKLGIPVVCGVGGNNTANVIDQIRKMNFNGISAIMSISPYYNKPSQQGILAHYIAIAAASPVPVILYNVPSRTGSNIEIDTIISLSHHKNIIGIKEASGSITKCMEIMKTCTSEFILISGDDMLTLPMRVLGAKGVISVLANAFPQDMRSICYDDIENARQVTLQLLDINTLLYLESNTACIKYILSKMNLCNENVRLPLCSITDELKNKIDKILF